MDRRVSSVVAGLGLLLALGCGDDGSDGEPCTVASTASGATITCPDGSTADVSNGMDGAPGATGPTGPAGPTGPTGAPGADGSDGAPGAIGATGPTGPEGPAGADGVGCTTSLIADGYEITCSDGTIYIDTLTGDSTELASAEETAGDVVLVASKKNGGAGGSRWFDASIDLASPTTLQLPAGIPAEGNVGNGQKLYVLFDDGTDCAWFSTGGVNGSYVSPRCFAGATRNGGTSSGFSGGTELFISEVADAAWLEMTVAGASGSGVITTATATFVFVP